MSRSQFGVRGRGAIRFGVGNAPRRIHFSTEARPIPVSRMMADARRPASCKRLTRANRSTFTARRCSTIPFWGPATADPRRDGLLIGRGIAFARQAALCRDR